MMKDAETKFEAINLEPQIYRLENLTDHSVGCYYMVEIMEIIYN